MNLLYSHPNELVTLMTRWLVPLFILYNIVGWVGLPGREANRSHAAQPNVVVTGMNFVAGTTFEWRDATGMRVDPTAAGFTPAATFQNAAQLIVSRPAAVMRGSRHKLTLISPILLRATSKEV